MIDWMRSFVTSVRKGSKEPRSIDGSPGVDTYARNQMKDESDSQRREKTFRYRESLPDWKTNE